MNEGSEREEARERLLLSLIGERNEGEDRGKIFNLS